MKSKTNPIKILIVDDDKDDLFEFVRYMKDKVGYDITVLVDGREAMSMINDKNRALLYWI